MTDVPEVRSGSASKPPGVGEERTGSSRPKEPEASPVVGVNCLFKLVEPWNRGGVWQSVVECGGVMR